MIKKIIIFLLIATILATVGVWFFNGSRKPAVVQTSTPADTLATATTTTSTESDNVTTPIQKVIDTVSLNPNNQLPTAGADTEPQIPATSTSEITPDDSERFVVSIGNNDIDSVMANLLDQGFISDKEVFKKAVNSSIVTFGPGGYKLSKTMPVLKIVKILQGKPYMVWVIIPEGLRKEETADLLANELGWNMARKQQLLEYTATSSDYIEGIYFPDTYLIPVDEDPVKVAQRLQAKFNEKFAVYLPEFNKQNIKWTTGLTFASIIQREAADASDMPLISGILWNRIGQEMALNTDATLQYARGNTGNGWWAPISVADKQTDSPYNTYTNKGLPPHPICSPGIAAIEATLTPAKTDCLYYLHDRNHISHCAKTYEEHLDNIEKYLK